jgi:porin
MLVVLALSGATSVPAEERTPGMASHLLESDRLLGDPGGRRSRLEQLGIALQLFYHQTLSGKPSGGGARSGSAFGTSGSYDFFTRLDLETAMGWRGGDALLHVKGQYDDSINGDVGALSDPIDDADFDSAIYVDELWLQQAVLERRLRARVGFMEQQTIFDRNAFANSEDRQFLTAFLDNNAVVPLPNGLAATFFALPAPWLELALGVADADNRPRSAGFDTFFDGVESLTSYLEARLTSPWQASGLRGAYRVGVLRDGRRLVDFGTGRRNRGHFGAYGSFDQVVWAPEADSGPRLGLFARVGWADPDVNRVEWFWSAGFELRGPIPGRRRDVLGFGTYQTHASDTYQDEVDSRFDREMGFELYYAVRLLGWLVVTPDVQYIVDPGARGEDDAIVGTLRARVAF